MPQNYIAAYSTDQITYTDLTNVQDIALFVGRQRQLDPYNASSATIVIRYPTGYASPITALTSGNYIRITNSGNGQRMFYGAINNVEVRYGVPYAGGVGQADYMTISVEGSFARFGRVQGLDYAITSAAVWQQILQCQTQTGLGIIAGSLISQVLAATTVSGTWGDWVNKLLVSINGRIWDAYSNSVNVLSPFELYSSAITFSDTTNNATNQVYDQINFGSYADNYYTQVTVDPESFSAATVQTGSAPYRTLLTNTFNASTAQATDYANYLLANYDSKGFALLSISCLAEAQNTFKLDSISGYLPATFAATPGTTVSVVFRGTTFNCVVEGVSMTATPQSSRYTYYLSGADLNAYLLLDSTVFGRLDYNKLGY